MSQKIGLIFFLMVFLQAFVLILDIANVQLVSSRLIVESNYVNTLMIKNNGYSDEVSAYVNDVLGGRFTCLSSHCKNITSGESISYKLSVDYTSVYKQEIKSMSIVRKILFGINI
ncbi:MAG: hypothetical protein LBM99_04405 [Bacillales bacterium]|jgi:hypothetical protein|nr:hypothetical protein [Bacillales bacterium]